MLRLITIRQFHNIKVNYTSLVLIKTATYVASCSNFGVSRVFSAYLNLLILYFDVDKNARKDEM